MDDTPKNLPAAPISGTAVAALLGGIARASAGSSLNRNPILKMSVLGVWGMGQANDLVQQGSRWLVGTHSFRHGYVAWHEGKIVDEKMVPAKEDRPAPPAATHATGAEYKTQIMVDLRCMNGEDAGDASGVTRPLRSAAPRSCSASSR